MHRRSTDMPCHYLRLLAGSLLLGGLLGCGYKGPLYLPPPEDPPAELTQPPAPSGQNAIN